MLDLQEAKFAPPTQADLEGQALTFYKENRPKLYRSMKKDGTLQEECAAKANLARKHADSLIRSGTYAAQAWYMAICLQICEREAD